MSAPELSKIVTRLENVTSRLENIAIRGSDNGGLDNPDEVVAPFVQAFDVIVQGPFANFFKLSQKIGDDVKNLVEMVKNAFNVQRQFLVVASKSQPPPQNMLMQLLKPTSDLIQSVQDFREKHRTSVFFNHLSAISESIPALGWVAVSPTPAPYIKEMVDSSQFYTNRVLVDYKEKDATHVNWVKAWIQTLTELQAYVKQFHTTGLVWNPKGKSASAISSPSVGGAPPPPPGPPPPPPPNVDFSSMGDPFVDDRAALFKDINQGEDISKTLKHVSTDLQTHKNPTLRMQGPAPYKPATAGAKPFRVVSAPSVNTAAPKPPKTELQGKKWIVEHHKDNHNILLDQIQMNQAVYAFNCTNCTIQVQGKLNSITLDQCKKTSLVFDTLVAAVEFINCQSIQAQAMGKVPTISIDKTDGVQVYLGPQSLDTEIISSKSSEMNIMIPKDNDYVEYPVPEQYKTRWTGRGLATEVVEQKG